MEIIRSMAVGITGILLVSLVFARIIYISPDLMVFLLGVVGLWMALVLCYLFGAELRDLIKEWRQ